MSPRTRSLYGRRHLDTYCLRSFQDQAWDAARRTALDLMRTQQNADVNWLTCRFEVADEVGEIVFELPFTEVAVAK
jgi:hypothetical protein